MKRSHLILTLAGGAAALTLGVTVAIAAPALAAPAASTSVLGSASAPASTSASTSCPGTTLRQTWSSAPRALKSALRDALRSDDRIAALTQVRDDALAGAYGDAVRDAVADGPLAAWKGQVPDALKSDVADLRSLDTRREKVAAGREIWASALAGDYGADVQAAAEGIQQCRSAAGKG